MGKIADAYVEIAADDVKFKSQVAGLGKTVDDAVQRSKAATSRALLDVSRGVQDFAAAGITGIVNNVEGIARNVATAMGKSAQLAGTVAGGVTIAAVAVQALSPLLRQLSEETYKFFGFWKSGADIVKTSVAGMMDGGTGLKALSAELQKQAEFLMNRSDSPTSYSLKLVGVPRIVQEGEANNQRRAIEASALMSQAFEKAAAAAFQLEAAQRGAAARFNLTTGQKDAGRLNEELFQSAVDKFGGGDNLRTKITSEARRQLGMNRTQSQELYGRFSMGDVPATKQVERLLDLTAERGRIMADDWERATGAANELRSIEEKRISDEKRRAAEFEAGKINRMERDTAKAARDLIDLPQKEGQIRERMAEFEADRTDRLNRSFMFAGLSDARDKLFTAAVDNKRDELTASKMASELDKVVKAIEKLNQKWEMK